MRRSAKRGEGQAAFHRDLGRLVTRLQGELRLDGPCAVPVTSDNVGAIGGRKGAYLLALHLPRNVELDMAKRPRHVIARGCYVYAGSAYGPGGLSARLQRHLRAAKTVRWHVDHLTTQAGEMMALAVPGGHECRLVERLLATQKFTIAVPGFGSSDCRTCAGHLLAACR